MQMGIRVDCGGDTSSDIPTLRGKLRQMELCLGHKEHVICMERAQLQVVVRTHNAISYLICR